MSERNKARAERIREEIDISQVLVQYGYHVHPGAEHQFSCDLHGDGFDSKPSARVYPESASWFCWACDKTRDAIQTVRDKEGIGFHEALKWLEQQFGLPPLPWDDEHDRKEPETNPFEETYRRERTYEEERRATLMFIDDLTADRAAPMELLLGLWEAFDMIEYQMRKETWTGELGARGMVSLLAQARTLSAEHNRAQ